MLNIILDMDFIHEYIYKKLEFLVSTGIRNKFTNHDKKDIVL